MKTSFRLLSLVTLALATSACSHMQVAYDYPCPTPFPIQEGECHHTCNATITTIDAVVYFNSGSDQLTAEGDAAVRNAAATINSSNFRGSHIIVEGYADSTGKADANHKLSHRRAVTVMHALIAQGVPANMLSARGFGATNPVNTNSTADGKAANRRVTFTVQ